MPNTIRYHSTFIPKPNTRVHRPKTKEELAKEKFEEQMNSPNRIVRWGAIARSEKFTKGMTKYLVGGYIFFLIYGVHFMKKQYAKEKELEKLEEKEQKGQANEYECLRIKELRGKLRRRDELKLERYREMQKHGKETFDGIVLENNDENKTNIKILPARDTTDFYNGKAADYDSDVNFEEKAIFMGRRRKWLMKHCHGDVLEVACGTGRNIKYLDMAHIKSITFLDASKNMMEIAHGKFRKEFPNYKKAAFVVGKAENLMDLAKADPNPQENSEKTDRLSMINGVNCETRMKYDTILEAFGLCSHEDPVKSLKNLEKLLKPGGRIVLLEHGRGHYDFINKILDDRAEKRLETWGCRWNLDLGEILDDSGLEIVEEHRTHMGTTWCIVAKRKGDAKKKSEVGFMEKYFGSSIKSKIEAFEKTSQDSEQKKGN